MKSEKCSPLYEAGMLLCPHCKSPLLVEETRKGDFKCVICSKLVGALSIEVMMELVDDVPAELLREWEIEMSVVRKKEGLR
jgi:uncharacterized protein YbaR (Trm112 family)